MSLYYRNKFIAALLTVVITLSSMPFMAKAEKKASGTYQCDWFDESLYYPYDYDDSWFSGDSYEYNHKLALLALNISMASFNSFNKDDRSENIRAMLENCGFKTKAYGYETEGYDTAAVEMARKTVTENGESCTVVIAAVRSGNYGMEWGGNMRIGSGENHLGFDIAKETVLNYINDYFADENISGRVKLLIPGYSRGGSIANLIGAELDDGSYRDSLKRADSIKNTDLAKNDIYVYTFEAPQCTKNSGADGKMYGNIINIMNPNDYVPKFVMKDWGFSRYGVEYYLPSAENCANYSSYYENVCKTFDTLMEDTDKKSDSNFYNEEDSRSVGAMFDSLMSKLADSVFKNQQYYAENFEDGLVFIAGQYIGKKLNAGNAMKTLGVIIAAVALGIIPTNMDTIKSDGFRAYLASRIAESDASSNLTKPQIQGIIDVVIALLEFAKENRSDVKALLGQLNTVLNVHQPYVTLSWMRSIGQDDMLKINGEAEKPLHVSFNRIDLRYKANARITADYDSSLGSLHWNSDSDNVVSVDEDGFITAKGDGDAIITVELRSEDGKLIDSERVRVTVHMNTLEAFVTTVKNIFGKAAA
ncbi:MAG TPA: hypothetical protein DCY31_07445 [Ruminococcaceae bacterium]|nr:hypothetical protein [Oscillospiraceae bacterium]